LIISQQIFKDGKKTTREKAIKKGIHLVSVLWVESCRQSGKHVSEDLFPVVEPEQAVTPLMVGRLKRTKSMQPKAFEEDVQNSAGRTGSNTLNVIILYIEVNSKLYCTVHVSSVEHV